MDANIARDIYLDIDISPLTFWKVLGKDYSSLEIWLDLGSDAAGWQIKSLVFRELYVS